MKREIIDSNSNVAGGAAGVTVRCGGGVVPHLATLLPSVLDRAFKGEL